MLTLDKIKMLESVKEDKQEFKEQFVKLLWETCEANLTLLELDETLDLLYEGKIEKLYELSERWVNSSREKVLGAIEEGKDDPVYAARYKAVKQINDLITYYKETKLD